MNETITAHILLIVFNRPETSCVVFEYIQRPQPQKLYVALDGPREDKLYEDIVCQEIFIIFQNVNRNCEVRYKISERNLDTIIPVSETIVPSNCTIHDN